MSARIGSLFSGYGGLDLGVEAVLGGSVAWVSDVDKGACKILDHRYPGVPNLGDVTAVDWSAVEPVDIITGGSPCQDLSHAGKRAGMTEGTRSNLWVAMREAVAALRPGLVIWENVRGAYSACADSEMGQCPRCLGDDPRGRHVPSLRALGRVLGDLADLGYDAGWHGVRASDVGAPHQRFRVFVVAYPADAEHEARPTYGSSGQQGPQSPAPLDDLTLLPTPRASDGPKGGPNQRGSSGDLMLPSAVAQLLPTPAVNDMGAAYTPETWDEWTERMKAAHGNGNGHGKSLSIEAQRLLPTPGAIDGNGGPKRIREDGRTEADHGPALRDVAVAEVWGDYADAIARWEHTLGRPAPPPTMTSSKGNPQLAPAFVEWMMGLPAGWVTDTPGITRNEALKALGNGVVPQQAAHAVAYLLAAIEQATVA